MHRQLTKTLIMLMAEEVTFAVLLIVAMQSTNNIALALALIGIALLLLTIYIDIRTATQLAREIDNDTLRCMEAISGIIDNEMHTNENFRMLAEAIKKAVNPEEETENTDNDNDRQ